MSQSACTSLSGCRAKFRTRFGPQYPQPITPTRIGRTVISLKRGVGSRSAARIEQNDGQCLEQDLEVEPQGPLLHVLQVQLAHLAVGEAVPAGYLPQTRDPWQCPQPVELPV